MIFHGDKSHFHYFLYIEVKNRDFNSKLLCLNILIRYLMLVLSFSSSIVIKISEANDHHPQNVDEKWFVRTTQYEKQN